jgi:hypothetical protein
MVPVGTDAGLDKNCLKCEVCNLCRREPQRSIFWRDSATRKNLGQYGRRQLVQAVTHFVLSSCLSERFLQGKGELTDTADQPEKSVPSVLPAIHRKRSTASVNRGAM